MIATIKYGGDHEPISFDEAVQMPPGILLVMRGDPDNVYMTTDLSEWPFVKLAPNPRLVGREGFSGRVPFELFRGVMELRNSPERLSGERG